MHFPDYLSFLCKYFLLEISGLVIIIFLIWKVIIYPLNFCFHLQAGWEWYGLGTLYKGIWNSSNFTLYIKLYFLYVGYIAHCISTEKFSAMLYIDATAPAVVMAGKHQHK